MTQEFMEEFELNTREERAEKINMSEDKNGRETDGGF